jgi:hypothetical protein
LVVKNRFEIEIMIFLLIGVGLLTGVGSPTPWRGGGECLVTIIRYSVLVSRTLSALINQRHPDREIRIRGLTSGT